MWCIPFYPLIRFVGIVMRNGGISGKGWLHVFTWTLKLILLEPLRWSEAVIFHHRIQSAVPDPSPIFIMGHYRSGTTFLQRCFMQDRRLGRMNAFEQVAPDMMLLWQRPLKALMQVLSNLFGAYNHYHRVPYDWSFPGEEDLGLMAMASPAASSWGFLFPARFKTLFLDSFDRSKAARQARWSRDYLYLVRRLTIRNKGRTLVLKSPPHTARVRQLVALFPEARFIHITRDPYALFASTRRLWRVTLRLHVLGSTRDVDVDSLILDTMTLFQQKWMEDVSSLRPGQYVEIRYEDLLRDPAGTLRGIYVELGLPDYAACEKAMETFLAGQRSYETLRHTLSEAEMALVNQRFRQPEPT